MGGAPAQRSLERALRLGRMKCLEEAEIYYDVIASSPAGIDEASQVAEGVRMYLIESLSSRLRCGH